MSVEVQGLGPVFRLVVTMRNDRDQMLRGLTLVFLPERIEQYAPDVPHVQLPSMVPELDYDFMVRGWSARLGVHM